MLDGIYCAHQFHVFDFNLSCLLRKFIYRMIVKPVAKLRPTYIIDLAVFVSLYGQWQQKAIARKILKYNRRSVWTLGAKATRMTAGVRKNYVNL